MKRFVTLLLTLCFLVTLGLNSAAGAEGIHLEGSPWTNSNLYGNWPLELPGPEENFELYVNYDLYREISSMMEEERIGQISRTDQKVLDMMRGLCQDQGKAGSEEECLRILYSLYTEAEREEKSFAALMNCVDKLKAVGTLDELTNLISEEGFLYSPNVFYYEIMESMEGKYIMGVTIEQILDDLPVPDDAEYDGIPAKDAEGTKKKLLAMRYTEEEATRLTEQLLAYDSSWDRVYELTERESELDFKGDLSLNEIREICPQACEVMAAQGVVKEGREEEPMYQILPITSALGFRELYRQENLELIKAIIALKLYRLYEIASPMDQEDASAPESFVSFLSIVPRAVKEQAFVHNFVPQERIDTYYSLTAEYIEALRARIERNDWLDAETKQKASEKLDHLIVADLLYPYGEMDCEPLRIALRSCGSLPEAVACCIQFEHQCLLTFVGQEPRRGNRYLSSEGTLKSEGNYQPSINVFYIGAAALVDGACDFTSRETILGSIGSHIGHELSHGYDTNGAQLNAEGTGPLFTEEDGRNFMARAASIAAKMSRIEALDGIHVKGEQVISEELADLTGLSLSLDLAKKTENFDYAAFFRAFAKFYFTCFGGRETMVNTYESDVHPATFVRVNYGVAQFDEFYQAYPTVTEGTPMYIAPEDREVIW